MPLEIVGVRLSNNPNTDVSVDGRFNLTSDGREFLIVDLQDADNIFSTPKTRTIFQQFDSTGKPVWRIPINKVKTGVVVPGTIVTMEVEPYDITSNGKTNTVNTYSAAVFGHEIAETVFLNAGHKPIGSTRELPPRFRNQTRPAVAPTRQADHDPETLAASEIVRS